MAAAVGPTNLMDHLNDSSLLQTPPRSSIISRSQFDSVSSHSPPSSPSKFSPPSSPSRLLRQSDCGVGTNWLPNDFSLSSLLDDTPYGGGESPTKAAGGSGNGTNVLPPSLISALNDTNTVDFTSTFANLKKQTKED